MSYDIKQSSAESALLFFLTLSSDHLSPATGLSPAVTLSKNGGAFAAPAGAISEISNGWYKLAANATDTNTLGPLALHASVATADNCDMIVGNIVKYDPQLADLGLTSFQMPEGYAAKGIAPTLAQFCFAQMGMLGNSQWVPGGTTGTLKAYKLDGVTVFGTWVGNDPNNPTSLLRAT